MATAGRAHVGDTGGEGRERLERFAELRQRQRLHVVLDVGGLAGRVGAREAAELRRRHGHRPTAAKGIVEPDLRQRKIALVLLVHGGHARDLVGTADLQVILQVLADPFQLVANHDAVLLQQRPRPDPRKLQDLGRADGAGSHDHLPARDHRPGSAVLLEDEPVTRRPSSVSHCTWASVAIVRFFRCLIGCRKPLAVFQRTPDFWLTWK